jgi:hypothetical protein
VRFPRAPAVVPTAKKRQSERDCNAATTQRRSKSSLCRLSTRDLSLPFICWEVTSGFLIVAQRTASSSRCLSLSRESSR